MNSIIMFHKEHNHEFLDIWTLVGLALSLRPSRFDGGCFWVEKPLIAVTLMSVYLLERPLNVENPRPQTVNPTL